MEQNRESRNEPIHIWIITFYKGTKKIQCRNDGLFKEFLDKTAKA